MQRIKPYIYQTDDWPDFTWDQKEIVKPLSDVRHLQGLLLGRMRSLGFDLQNEAMLATLSLDVIKSAEIEGENLSVEQVRSSVAKRLGIEIAGSVESDRNVDGMVEMMIDATKYCFQRLTADRLFDWHAALFPTGRTGMNKIKVADWRVDSTGPMQVISGPLGKERVHFQAPESTVVPDEMERFLDWFNFNQENEMVIKAAIAHLWFVTIHPFEDGNGRIARAITDMLLAQADSSTDRFYSMSAQIRVERKSYYEILEKTQQGNMDITNWILWFLSCLKNALNATDTLLTSVLFKAEFWNHHAKTQLNERQRKLLNKLLDGFEGKLTSSKWAKIAKCSKDTAIRDINDLIEKHILQKETAGGRSTNYGIRKPTLNQN